MTALRKGLEPAHRHRRTRDVGCTVTRHVEIRFFRRIDAGIRFPPCEPFRERHCRIALGHRQGNASGQGNRHDDSGVAVGKLHMARQPGGCLPRRPANALRNSAPGAAAFGAVTACRSPRGYRAGVPMARNFSRRKRSTSSGCMPPSDSTSSAMASPTICSASSGFRWAPPAARLRSGRSRPVPADRSLSGGARLPRSPPSRRRAREWRHIPPAR